MEVGFPPAQEAREVEDGDTDCLPRREAWRRAAFRKERKGKEEEDVYGYKLR